MKRGIKNRSRKAINFDLDTTIMKTYVSTDRGYKQIKRFMLRNDYEHRQGSGYVSNKAVSTASAINTVTALVQRYTWIAACVKDIMLTDYTKASDLTQIVKNVALQNQTTQGNTPAPFSNQHSSLSKILHNNRQALPNTQPNLANNQSSSKPKNTPTQRAKTSTRKSLKGGGSAL